MNAKGLLDWIAGRSVWTLGLWLVLTVLVSVQMHVVATQQPAGECSVNGNYRLFVNSFDRLLEHKNLYRNDYPDQCYGYKYSPTFALGFGVFSVFPEVVGMILWSCLPILLLHVAIYRLPRISDRQKLLIALLLLPELISNLRAQQSNVLALGLVLTAFQHMEGRKPVWAALFVVMAGFIKIYVAGIGILFLFYPNKGRFVSFALIWALVLALLPLVVVSLDQLIKVYAQWYYQVTHDMTVYAGNSVHGFWEKLLGDQRLKSPLIGVSFLMSLAALTQYRKWNDLRFRMLSLSMLLMWMVAFNPKAESPTYVIAMGGAFIWMFARPATAWRIALFCLILASDAVFHSDLVPRAIRKSIVYPYALKGVITSMVWFANWVELWFLQAEDRFQELRTAWAGTQAPSKVATYRLW